MEDSSNTGGSGSGGQRARRQPGSIQITQAESEAIQRVILM